MENSHLQEEIPGNASHANFRAPAFAPYIIVLAFSFLFFSPVLVKNRPIISGDYFDFNVPNRVYTTERMRQGDLPQWTDAIMGGFPFICDPQPGTFFPPNMLLSAFVRDVGNSFIIDRYYILQCAALALGGVFLARSFGFGSIAAVAAGIFTLTNGYVIMHFGHMNVMQGIVAAVWAFGMVVRALHRQSFSYAFAAALFLSGTVTAGHAQIPLHAFYAVTIVCILYTVTVLLRSRNWRNTAPTVKISFIVLILGFLAGAMQTLPTLSITRISSRHALSIEDAMLFQTPVEQLAGFLMPGLYQALPWRMPPGSWHNINWRTWGKPAIWEYLYPIGVVAFGLGVFGAVANWRRRLVWFLVISCALLGLAALGSRGFIYPLVYEFAPGFKHVRVPPRLLWLFMCAWAVLAGLGVNSLARGFTRRSAYLTAVILGVMAAAGAATLLVTRAYSGSWFEAFNRLFVFIPHDIRRWRAAPDFVRDILAQLVFTGVLLTLVIAIFLLTRRSGSKISAAIVTVLLAVELCAYGFHRNISTRHQPITTIRSPALDALPDNPNGRVAKLDNNLYYRNNSALGYGEKIHDIEGYNPISIKWIAPLKPAALYPRGQFDEKLLDLWNVRYLTREKRTVKAVIEGRRTEIVEANRLSISHMNEYRPFIEWNLKEPVEAGALEMFCTAQHSANHSQGSSAATVSLLSPDGLETTFSLRFGIDIADWTHGSPTLPRVTGHGKPVPAYIQPIDGLAYFDGAYYGARFELDTTQSVSKVRIAIAAQHPAVVHVGAIRLVTDDGAHPLMPETALNYRLLSRKVASWEVLERSTAYGDAWMVPRARPVSYKKDMHYAKLALMEIDPLKAVLVDKRKVTTQTLTVLNAARVDFNGTSTLTKHSPENFAVNTMSNDRGWLVLSHPWMPGWKAWLDGKRAEIMQANGAHMAVAVPEGKHRLEFRYTTPGLIAGLSIGGAAWLLSLTMIGRGILRSRKRRSR